MQATKRKAGQRRRTSRGFRVFYFTARRESARFRSQAVTQAWRFRTRTACCAPCRGMPLTAGALGAAEPPGSRRKREQPALVAPTAARPPRAASQQRQGSRGAERPRAGGTEEHPRETGGREKRKGGGAFGTAIFF